jgi:hypothetical protein
MGLWHDDEPPETTCRAASLAPDHRDSKCDLSAAAAEGLPIIALSLMRVITLFRILRDRATAKPNLPRQATAK